MRPVNELEIHVVGVPLRGASHLVRFFADALLELVQWKRGAIITVGAEQATGISPKAV